MSRWGEVAWMWCHHAHKTYEDWPCRRRLLPSVNQSINQSNPPPHFSLSRATSSTDQRSKEPPPPHHPPHPAPGATPDHAYLKPVSPARPPTHLLEPISHPSKSVKAANHLVQSITPLSSPATAALDRTELPKAPALSDHPIHQPTSPKKSPLPGLVWSGLAKEIHNKVRTASVARSGGVVNNACDQRAIRSGTLFISSLSLFLPPTWHDMSCLYRRLVRSGRAT
ncbi:uncharacterized protein LY79DRAFT_113665 [Colletotrichum navitas]|uniref:Uncharacterized protein n=1 Tax=Colletotrichum navitas TaxID=681940 RepID=A0AAD8PK96_9PEZI|nr:uncharacterized protein LY79DRAFT_113665 [Colletotrichum navitas]KAK1566034.1 hypothetical protein LY79DRAFT_113665 [Colletotrichum navitas]